MPKLFKIFVIIEFYLIFISLHIRCQVRFTTRPTYPYFAFPYYTISEPTERESTVPYSTVSNFTVPKTTEKEFTFLTFNVSQPTVTETTDSFQYRK